MAGLGQRLNVSVTQRSTPGDDKSSTEPQSTQKFIGEAAFIHLALSEIFDKNINRDEKGVETLNFTAAVAVYESIYCSLPPRAQSYFRFVGCLLKLRTGKQKDPQKILEETQAKLRVHTDEQLSKAVEEFLAEFANLLLERDNRVTFEKTSKELLDKYLKSLKAVFTSQLYEIKDGESKQIRKTRDQAMDERKLETAQAQNQRLLQSINCTPGDFRLQALIYERLQHPEWKRFQLYVIALFPTDPVPRYELLFHYHAEDKLEDAYSQVARPFYQTFNKNESLQRDLIRFYFLTALMWFLRATRSNISKEKSMFMGYSRSKIDDIFEFFGEENGPYYAYRGIWEDLLRKMDAQESGLTDYINKYFQTEIWSGINRVQQHPDIIQNLKLENDQPDSVASGSSMGDGNSAVGKAQSGENKGSDVPPTNLPLPVPAAEKQKRAAKREVHDPDFESMAAVFNSWIILFERLNANRNITLFANEFRQRFVKFCEKALNFVLPQEEDKFGECVKILVATAESRQCIPCELLLLAYLYTCGLGVEKNVKKASDYADALYRDTNYYPGRCFFGFLLEKKIFCLPGYAWCSPELLGHYKTSSSPDSIYDHCSKAKFQPANTRIKVNSLLHTYGTVSKDPLQALTAEGCFEVQFLSNTSEGIIAAAKQGYPPAEDALQKISDSDLKLEDIFIKYSIIHALNSSPLDFKVASSDEQKNITSIKNKHGQVIAERFSNKVKKTNQWAREGRRSLLLEALGQNLWFKEEIDAVYARDCFYDHHSLYPTSTVPTFPVLGAAKDGDIDARVHILKFLCESSHLGPSAKTELGKYYEQGIGVKKDCKHAWELYISAGDYGPALVQRGRLYEESKEKENALKCYRRARDLGDMTARCHLSLHTSVAGEQAELLKEPLEQNHPMALEILASKHFAEIKQSSQENKDDTERLKKEAFLSLMRAGEAGSVKSQLELFQYLLEGKVFPKNIAEAFYWLQKAAIDEDCAAAQSMLGSYYCVGVDRVVPKDLRIGIELYRMAARRGDAKGQLELAKMLDAGHPSQIANESIHWYEKAAESEYKTIQQEALSAVSYFNFFKTNIEPKLSMTSELAQRAALIRFMMQGGDIDPPEGPEWHDELVAKGKFPLAENKLADEKEAKRGQRASGGSGGSKVRVPTPAPNIVTIFSPPPQRRRLPAASVSGKLVPKP